MNLMFFVYLLCRKEPRGYVTFDDMDVVPIPVEEPKRRRRQGD